MSLGELPGAAHLDARARAAAARAVVWLVMVKQYARATARTRLWGGTETMSAGAGPAWTTIGPGACIRLTRVLRRLPLSAYVYGFGLVVVLPAILFSAALILQFSRQQQELAQAQVSGAAQNISASVDRQLTALITTARVLAASPLLDTGDFSQFHRSAMAALEGSNNTSALIGPDFQPILTTALPYDGSRHPARPGTTPIIESVFKTQMQYISNLSYSPRRNIHTVFVAVPVLRNGGTRFVLAVETAAGKLKASVEEDGRHPHLTVTIRGRDAQAIDAPGSKEGNGNKFEDQPSIVARVENSLDADLIEASHVSQLSGWSTTVAMRAEWIERPILRSWFWLAIVGLFLGVFCFALTIFFTRRLVQPITALTAQARAIGEGKAMPAITSAIEEFAEVSRVLASASRERLDAEEQNRFLMHEMAHRVKNQYALIGAIAHRAAKQSSSTAEFHTTLSDALDSLARSSDLLAQSGWECAKLRELVLRQLQPFGASRATGQFQLDGPDLPLNVSSVQTIGLALHELATNAAKYGALSAENGTVTIEWSVGVRFRLRWQERGGPPVVAPKRTGFGTSVIHTMTARGLGGEVRLDYAVDGLVWNVDAPIEMVRA